MKKYLVPVLLTTAFAGEAFADLGSLWGGAWDATKTAASATYSAGSNLAQGAAGYAAQGAQVVGNAAGSAARGAVDALGNIKPQVNINVTPGYYGPGYHAGGQVSPPMTSPVAGQPQVSPPMTAPVAGQPQVPGGNVIPAPQGGPAVQPPAVKPQLGPGGTPSASASNTFGQSVQGLVYGAQDALNAGAAKVAALAASAAAVGIQMKNDVQCQAISSYLYPISARSVDRMDTNGSSWFGNVAFQAVGNVIGCIGSPNQVRNFKTAVCKALQENVGTVDPNNPNNSRNYLSVMKEVLANIAKMGQGQAQMVNEFKASMNNRAASGHYLMRDYQGCQINGQPILP